MPHHIVTRIFESYHDISYYFISFYPHPDPSPTVINTHLEGVPADSTNISSKRAFFVKLKTKCFWGGNSQLKKQRCFEGCQAIKSHLLSHNFLRQTRENATWNCPKTNKNNQTTTDNSSHRFSKVILLLHTIFQHVFVSQILFVFAPWIGSPEKNSVIF